MKNPILFFLITGLTVLNIIDYITAMFILKGESNPLFLITGNMIPVLIVKILIIGGLYYYWYRNIYPNNFTLYMLIVIIMYSLILLSIAIYSNILGMLNPQILEASSQLSMVEKSQGYYSIISIIYIIPAGLTLLCFWVYEKINKHVVIDKEYFKRRKWWQP